MRAFMLSGWRVSALFLAACLLVGGTAASASAAYVKVFADSFTDGTAAGDRDWVKAAGGWSVSPLKTYVSAPAGLDLSYARSPRLAATTSYLLTTRIKLTGATRSPNGGLLVAYQSGASYLALQMTTTRLILTQKGNLTGEGPGTKASVARNFARNVWYTLGVSLGADGTVSAYVNNVRLFTRRFPKPLSGRVGLMANRAKTEFDVFTLKRDAVVIPAPSGLQAIAQSSSQVFLAWTDNSADETAFRVERAGTCAGPFAEVGTLAANVVSYVAAGLGAGTPYCFRVRATAGQSTSGYSGTAGATTLPAGGALAAPTGLAAIARSYEQIDLSWADNSGAAETAFEIERATPNCSAAFDRVGQVGANVTSYSAKGLSPATAYCFRVRALGAGAYSAYSGTAGATTPARPASSPQGVLNLRATVLSSSSVALVWDDVRYETDYYVYWLPPGAVDPVFFYGLGENATSLTIIDLQPNSRYEWTVVAVNDYTPSIYQTVVTITPSSGKGTLQVVNQTGYDIVDLRVNGVSRLAAGQVVRPGQYWYDNTLAPGNYTVAAGIGANAQNVYFASTATYAVQADKTAQHFATAGDLMLSGWRWYGVEWTGTCSYVEHAVVFNDRLGNFTRSRNAYNCGTQSGWQTVQSGQMANVSWGAYSPILSFNLGVGGPYASIAYPFASLFTRIATGGGGQQLDRQRY